MKGEVEDKALVEQALEGSEDAVTELVRRFQRPVYTVILRMVHDPGLAEDLAQDAFVNAFRHLENFDRERKFASWLFKIAHNRTLDHLRRKRLDTVSIEGPDGIPSLIDRIGDSKQLTPDHEHLRSEIMEAFESALETLRPEYREVIVLRFQNAMSYREIADIVGLPLATVKTHIHRARKLMAAEIEKLGFAPTG